MDIVFGYQGKEHLTASQLRRYVAGTLGDGTYVLDTQDQFACTVKTANQVEVKTGDIVIQGGALATIETPETLTIDSGTTGQKRNDLIVARYSKTASTGVEKCELAVVKGTPVSYGDAADPSVNTGSIEDGDTVDVKLWRIPIDGLAPGTPVKLFTVVNPVSGIPAEDTNASDSTRFVTGGPTLVTKSGTRVWNWIASKIRSVFGFNSSNVLGLAKGGTGATDAANARKNLGTPPTSHAVNANTYGLGTGSVYGHVKLSDSTTSTSGTGSSVAATPAAVKAVRDSLSQRVWTGTISGNGSATVSGASSKRLLAVKFGAYNITELVEGGNHGAQLIGGAHIVEGGTIVACAASVSISGNKITFSGVSYSVFKASGLGGALTYVAGDADTITRIWALG